MATDYEFVVMPGATKPSYVFFTQGKAYISRYSGYDVLKDGEYCLGLNTDKWFIRNKSIGNNWEHIPATEVPDDIKGAAFLVKLQY